MDARPQDEGPSQFVFVNGMTARVAYARHPSDLKTALRKLNLTPPKPTMVLVGGASDVNDSDLDLLPHLLARTFIPLLEHSGAAVVDGGTDAGVMQMMGRARARANASFSLVGVAAIGTISLPGASVSMGDTVPLEPDHSHFILVPGSTWGDEAPWLSLVATALARDVPSLTILINGGEIAWRDVALSVAAQRPVLVLAGTGRTADILANAVHGIAADERAGTLIATGLIHTVDADADSAVFDDTLQCLIGTNRRR